MAAAGRVSRGRAARGDGVYSSEMRLVLQGLLAVALGAPGLPAVVDLGTATGVSRVDGPAASAGFGAGALATGDLDGDGALDVVVGAPSARGGRGEVYVVFGVPGAGVPSRDLSVAPADVSIVGAATNVGLGVAAVAADLDADGADDLVVSTRGYFPQLGRLASGGALVFRGGPHWRERTTLDLATERADAVIVDTGTPAPAGVALAAGDFDADGYADVAVGSPSAERVGVHFGGAAFPAGETYDLAGDDRLAVVAARADGDGLGTDLAAGDVTGDRVDDLLLGTPNRTVLRAVTFEKAGTVFAISGARLRPGARIGLATDAADLEVLGSDYGDYLGRGLGAGDVTGDGVPDLVAGAIDGDGPTNSRYPDCGELYVVETGGGSGPRVVDLMQRSQWQWVVGDAPRRFFGGAVAVADFDADRRMEIAAASAQAPGPNGAESGVVYFVEGAAGTLDLASAAAAGIVVGPSTGSRLGSALRAADLDADGVADLVAAAPGASGGRGSVFVVHGTRTQANEPPALEPIGNVTVQAGTSGEIQFTASDPDGDAIRFRATGRPPYSMFTDGGDGTARLAVSPPAGATGSFTVRVAASDGQFAAAASFVVTVVAGPVPVVTKAVYRGGALKIRGERFAAVAAVTINGAAVTAPVVFKPAAGRLVVRASREALGLDPRPGANTIVVTVGGVDSAPFAF
jgi:hypothetical protein